MQVTLNGIDNILNFQKAVTKIRHYYRLASLNKCLTFSIATLRISARLAENSLHLKCRKRIDRHANTHSNPEQQGNQCISGLLRTGL